MRTHDFSYWPGPPELSYAWCRRCGCFAVTKNDRLSYFPIGTELTGHLRLENGLSSPPDCQNVIWLVEMREHRPTEDDPFEFDSLVVHSSRSKESALTWAKEDGPDLSDHDPASWWWMAIYPQGLDTESPEEAPIYLDWNGDIVRAEPRRGYADIVQTE